MESILAKIHPLEGLLAQAAIWRQAGHNLVFTNGCFDILHVGHVKTLSTARAQGDKLVVGLNSDQSVSRLKGPTRPLNNQRDRATMLAALSCVDAVVVFEEDTPNSIIERLQPEVHVKGGDYTVDDLPETPIVRAYGGRIVIVDLVPNRSTTNLIERSQGR